MFYYLLYFMLMAVVGYFAWKPLKLAAEYRFRSKFGHTIEGIGFAAVILFSILNIANFTGIVLLALGTAIGISLHSKKNNDRYLDE